MKPDSYTIEVKGNNSSDVHDLKEYRAIIELIEDMKDRLAIQSRSDDEDVRREDTEKILVEKFKL